MEAGIDGTCRLPPLINAGLSLGSRTARQVESRSRPTTTPPCVCRINFKRLIKMGSFACRVRHITRRDSSFSPFLIRKEDGRRTSRAVPWVAATKTPGLVSRSCRSHQLRNHLFSSSSKKEPLLLCSFFTRALGVLYVSSLSCHRLDEVERKRRRGQSNKTTRAGKASREEEEPLLQMATDSGRRFRTA